MRFFTDGHRVIRVHTDVRLDDRATLLHAKAETFQFRTGGWAERPNLTASVIFTGDWQPCNEEEAHAVLERYLGPTNAESAWR